MRSVLLGAALLLAATSAGQAQNYWLSGQQLALDHCEKNMSAANRYVTGVMDGYVTATGAGAKKQFCPRDVMHAEAPWLAPAFFD